jgi:hypothetical protein
MTRSPHVRVSSTHRPFHRLKIFLRSIEGYSQKLLHVLHEARGHLTKRLLETLEMDAQLQRTAACSGSANIGEVMATAKRVNLGDCDSCYLGMGDYFREDDAMPSDALASSGIHKIGAA